jgi:hypothetical protein
MTTAKQGFYRVKGLAQTELAEIEQLAQLCNAHDGLDLKINRELLRTRPHDQINALSLYHSCGFRETGSYDYYEHATHL